MSDNPVPPTAGANAGPAIMVPNRMFLEAAAGEEWGRVRVAMFACDPVAATAGQWAGAQAASMLRAPHLELNTYYSVSLQAQGGRRGIAAFERLFAIVLDDVEISSTMASPQLPAARGNTKLGLAAAEALLGPPSYILETSPGNCQAGWFCDLSDPEFAQGVTAAILGALGAGDNLRNLVGYMRLPVGTNRKAAYGPQGFRHRLVHWSPERRLTGIDWLDIDQRLGGIERGRGLPAGSGGADGPPRPAEEDVNADPVLQALFSLGRVQGTRGGRNVIRRTTMGWGVDIDCPWIEEHTARAREGAVYVPVLGRFHCVHGHCQDRGPAEFRERLSAMLAEAGLPSLAQLEFGGVAAPEISVADLDTGATARMLGIPSDLAELARYEVHEFGIIDAFEDRHAGDFLYDHRQGQWYRWDRDFWRPDEIDFVGHAIEVLIRDFLRAHVDLTQGRVNALTRMQTARAIEFGARHRPRLKIDGASWDADPFLCGVPGGEVDLKTGEILPSDPAHRISKQLLVAPRDMPTPLWDAFLAESTGGDSELIRFLQAWCGYCLTGDTSEEVFVFTWGPGGNGKGTFTGVMMAIMGRYACQAPADMFMRRKYDAHPEEIARLSDVRLVMVSELPGGRTFNTARLKDFTGRDWLTGRYMRKGSFDFKPYFKLNLVGNDQPRLPETGEAIGRRLILVPFTQTPAVPDPGLKGKLMAEYEGILHWMVQGETLRRSAGGLQALIPAAARNATREYLESQNDLMGWAAERCVFGKEHETLAVQMFDDYIMWCRAQDIYNSCRGAQGFGRKILELFQNVPCVRVHTEKGTVIRGIKLLEENINSF